MPDPIGVAVIGTGSIADAHLYSYQREEERARLLAVADIDESRAKRAAERFSVQDAHTDYREILARDDIGAVSICTPPFSHVEISVAALQAGKHVLCEKPVAPTLAGLHAIQAAAESSGRVFSGVFQLRFGRGAQQVRALLDEGRFGRLHLGIAETLWFRDHPYYDDVSWRGTWAQECGGVTVSQAIHLIDALTWFLGEPVSVYAHAGTFRPRIEEEDTAVAVIRYRNGAIGQVTSTVSAMGPERSRLEIYGTDLSGISQGTAYDSTAVPFQFGALTPDEAARVQEEIDARISGGYRLLHRGSVNDFLGAILENRGPLAGIEACRTALQVTAAIYKSSMTGEPVSLPITEDDPWYHSLPPEGFSLQAPSP